VLCSLTRQDHKRTYIIPYILLINTLYPISDVLMTQVGTTYIKLKFKTNTIRFTQTNTITLINIFAELPNGWFMKGRKVVCG